MAKGLTYEELMEYAKKHYNRGGDATYECWGRKDYEEWCKAFGPMTKSEALAMFRRDYDIQKDRAGYWM